MKKLSNREEKLIRGLRLKKTRQSENCFLIEGDKLLLEAMNSQFNIIDVYATPSWSDSSKLNIVTKEISERELKSLSNLKTPPGCIAIVEIPKTKNIEVGDLNLAIEHLQDPGNLGTIMRSAAAFGVKNVTCSTDTVDCYNPKVVQASMGAIFQLQITYTDLKTHLEALPENHYVYGAHLAGENIYQTSLKTPATLLMGNESNGISEILEKLIHKKLKIPQSEAVESLNVSMATAVILSEFRRQISWQ